MIIFLKEINTRFLSIDVNKLLIKKSRKRFFLSSLLIFKFLMRKMILNIKYNNR